MTNTNEHAYNDTVEKKTVNSWYIFVKRENKTIKFTVLDTGLGIPETINKRTIEKIRDKLSIVSVSESTYIREALHGKHRKNQTFSRSSTKLENRNTGLPSIYKFQVEGKINNLKIISNKGIYYNTKTNKNEDLNQKLKGTLFYWEIENKIESEVL